MQFRIADTFTDSLAKLTGEEQKAVKTTAFDLQLNPASPGLSFHKLDKARDKNFWSVRVNNDIRLIVHKPIPACSCATSIITTRRMSGRTAASSKHTPRPGRHSGWRSASGLRRPLSRSTSRFRNLPLPSHFYFFAGDLGQRIFQQPFSWKSLGVDIRGRSRTLHINYRTSHQIRMQADQLLGSELSDVDGNAEERRGTVSLFNGPAPVVRTFAGQQEEVSAVGAWLADRGKEGVRRA